VLGMLQRLDGTGDEAATRRRAGVLGSVILGTALSRYVLRLPPMATASADEVAGSLAPVLQQILGG
jgi:hypothetical protein